MPLAAPRRDAKRVVIALALVAAAVVAARLPFLLYGPRFFDSDEAVEGLMARHVLNGELPLFLWGQRYKGVPEVYLAAAVFRLFTPGVVALKAVTLACCAAYACLNFVLLTRLFSRRVAWMATAFLAAGPPSLVLWTLSGSAEIVMTWMAGTSLLLGFDSWRRTGSRTALVSAAAALGFGLWIQQYILYYVAAIAVAAIDWSPGGRAHLRDALVGGVNPWLLVALGIPAAAAGVYVALGIAAFLGLAFDGTPLGIPVTVSHPQKMWWIAAGLLIVCAAGLTVIRLTLDKAWRAWLAPALGFLAGYAPAIAGRLLSNGFGAPIARMDLAGLRVALPEFTGTALPIVFGFKSPATEQLAVPAWPALLLAGAILFSYVRAMRARDERRLSTVFHAFAILTPILFFASGSYFDAQSYRYLMPIHAALPVVYSVGIDGVLRANRIAGVVLLAAVMSVFVLQQADWYRRLEPDRETQAVVDCLERAGVRAAYADYWLSYKLTFLTDERVVVAPTTGVDRYPPYTAAARALAAPTIVRPHDGASCETVIRRSSLP